MNYNGELLPGMRATLVFKDAQYNVVICGVLTTRKLHGPVYECLDTTSGKMFSLMEETVRNFSVIIGWDGQPAIWEDLEI